MKQIKKILVAIGDEKSVDKCMSVAIPIAKGLNASITGVHVLPPYPRTFTQTLEPWRKHLSKNAEKDMEKAEKLCQSNDVSFHKKILKGLAREEILNFAKTNFDLIIMGRADWGSKLLGSVSSGIVHGAKTNVLLVQ